MVVDAVFDTMTMVRVEVPDDIPADGIVDYINREWLADDFNLSIVVDSLSDSEIMCSEVE